MPGQWVKVGNSEDAGVEGHMEDDLYDGYVRLISAEYDTILVLKNGYLVFGTIFITVV